MIGLAWLVLLDDSRLAGAVERLRGALSAAGVRDCGDVGGPGTAQADAVVVWADRSLPDDVTAALLGTGRPLVLAGPTLDRADPSGALADAAGVVPGAATGAHDIRVRSGRDGEALEWALMAHQHRRADTSTHAGTHDHLTDRVLRLEKVADDVCVLLVANVGLTTHPLATWRPSTRALAWTPGARPESVDSRAAIRLLLTALRHAIAYPPPRPVGVGLLGYGAIGHEHSRAIRHVPGLHLAAVCDTNAQRRAAATNAAPQLRAFTEAADLLADDDVDVVVVSTPPNTHAAWAEAVLSAGKHVIVEKPFAIRTEEADAVLRLARQHGLLAAVYQNRRFDPDHLAVRRAVTAGTLGDVFHIEAFVGGYGHPCNLWHSDTDVSGGAVYDWGAHVLDQLLDLMPGDIEHVTAAEQKRVWLDVTNADHSRVTMRFTSGAEATFVYSDLAAALKPRWYLLGTRGAIVGHWRTERVIARNDIGTLEEDVLAPADSPPLLDLHSPDGSVTRLATPPAAPYAFHQELADRLRLGLPMSITGEQSRRVLSVMEAATESVAAGARPVRPR